MKQSSATLSPDVVKINAYPAMTTDNTITPNVTGGSTSSTGGYINPNGTGTTGGTFYCYYCNTYYVGYHTCNSWAPQPGGEPSYPTVPYAPSVPGTVYPNQEMNDIKKELKEIKDLLKEILDEV